MATISSVGIGSGLDVNNIVSQLVALEKQPLKTLEAKATNVQAQISAFGDVQSQFASLTDVVTRIADSTTWAARKASSSNASAAGITVTSSATATTFALDVDQLALQQSVSSTQIAQGTAPGAGTLTLRLGTWSGGGSTFTPASGSADVAVNISATDTVANIAAKINASGAGVVATTFNDGANDRLLLTSKATGQAAGFRVKSDDAGLQSMVFDPQSKAGVGMASAGLQVQYGQDAKARINGMAVTSSTNTLANNLPGVTIDLLATTTTGYVDSTHTGVTSPLTMRVTEDVTPAVKNVSDFVDAYNKLNQTLTDLTKYDAATKKAGLFQGDSSVVGLQYLMRRMLTSVSNGSTYQRLSDVGISAKLDGSLTIDTAKLSVAANNGTALQDLFTTNNNNPMTNGFALKFKGLGQGVLASGGSVANKVASLKNSLDENSAAQNKVNDRATTVEARLRAQYSVLDGQMASLNALNAYVTQQVTQWNKSSA